MGRNENEFSENDGWGSPSEVLDPIYEHFGEIGLDPFGDPNAIVKANHYFFHPHHQGVLPTGLNPKAGITVGDGFTLSWGGYGLVFANGPWSDCAPWVYKAATEGDEVICLVPARTGANWFQHYVAPADVVLFWKGRLKFVGAKHHAPFHCVLNYWGERPELFLKAFPGHWYVRNHG